jgi:hypothetical protein
MSGENMVPTGLSGVVTKSEELSFCMDGATHLIHTRTGATRLKGSKEEVTRVLDVVSDGKTQVMVMGYLTLGPECMYLSVYQIAPVSDVNKVLGGDGRPWPWQVLV